MTRTARAAPTARPVLTPSPTAFPPEPDVRALDDRGLLTLMLRRSDGDAGMIAQELLARFGSLGAIVSTDLPELVRVTAGRDALIDLKVLQELAVRLARADACQRPVITSWTALQAYVRTAMAHRPREQFRVLFLDNRNTLMLDEFVAEGTVDHAPVYVVSVIDCYLALTAGRIARSAPQCGGREPVS